MTLAIFAMCAHSAGITVDKDRKGFGLSSKYSQPGEVVSTAPGWQVQRQCLLCPIAVSGRRIIVFIQVIIADFKSFAKHHDMAYCIKTGSKSCMHAVIAFDCTSFLDSRKIKEKHE